MEKQEHWKSSSEVVESSVGMIQQRMNKTKELLGLDTGFEDLNKLLAGLQLGQLVLLAGRPAMGKTALMQNIVLNIAGQGHGVGVFSFVDSAEQFMLRLIGIKSLVSMSEILNGTVDAETQLPNITHACQHIDSLPIFTQDRLGSVDDIIDEVRSLKETQDNLALVVIDHIGLVGAANSSQKLKMLAKELNVCILVLSPLSRKVEKRSDKRPRLTDFRKKADLVQEADVVCFIYRDEYYDVDSPEKGITEVIIAKQRNGPIGTIKLQFEGKHLRFYNLMPDYLDGFF